MRLDAANQLSPAAIWIRLQWRCRRYQVGEQIGAVQHARLCRYDTLGGRSIPVGFIGASGLIALQQGFPGSDYQSVVVV